MGTSPGHAAFRSLEIFGSQSQKQKETIVAPKLIIASIAALACAALPADAAQRRSPEAQLAVLSMDGSPVSRFAALTYTASARRQ
jgi:hypothetical protein